MIGRPSSKARRSLLSPAGVPIEEAAGHAFVDQELFELVLRDRPAARRAMRVQPIHDAPAQENLSLNPSISRRG